MNQELLTNLQGTLFSRGWQLVIKPALKRLRDGAVNSLLSPPKSDFKFSDDYIKGQANVLNWMLKWDERAEVLAQELSELEVADNQPDGTGSPYVPQPNSQPVQAS